MMKVILSETLKKLGVSQYALAKKAGISEATISNLCNNKTVSIQFYILDKICAALNCNIEDVIITESAFEKRMLLYSKLIKDTSENSKT